MNILLDYFLSVVLVVFEGYVIFRYMTIFHGYRFKEVRCAVLAYGLCLIISFVLVREDFYPIISALISFLCIFIISLCYEGMFLKHITVTVMTYMCLFASEAIVALFVGISKVDAFEKMEQGSVVINLVVKFIAWLVSLVISRFKNVDENQKIPRFFAMSVVLIPIALIALVCIIYSQETMSEEKRMITLLIFTPALLTMIYLYDSLEMLFKERTRSAIMIKEKEYYHRQSLILQDKYAEMRRYRHDMINRLVVIQQLIRQKNYEEAMRYTGEIGDKLEKTSNHISTGNIAMDSVINYKLGGIVHNNLSIKTHFAIPEKMTIDEDDIVVVIGNLLDNAIEAVKKMPDETKKYIYIDMTFDIGTLWICMKNSYGGVLRLDGNTLETSKANKSMHGIGLQSVRMVTEKYNGLLDYHTENNLFIVDVVLYI